MSWTDPGDADLDNLEVWRGLWHDGTAVSVYPEYDDDPGNTIPARPADRATAFASSEWQYAGSVSPGDETFTDVHAPRGVYYYEVFANDPAANFGPPADDNDRATNYWLGDFSPPVLYDGEVDIADVTVLGATYGTVDGDPSYDSEVDVGPTDDFSSLGIPATDDEIGFEDLMIVALDYYVVAPLRIDRQGAEISAGSLLEGQQTPYLLLNGDSHDVDLGLAILGAGATIRGQGELLRIALSKEVIPAALKLVLRSSSNEVVDYAFDAAEIPLLPSVTRIGNNFPNPFNPRTTIRFDLAEQQTVEIAVFDPLGRRIIVLVDEVLPAGFHSADWDGCDARGVRTASGVYFYRFSTPRLIQMEKMLLLQ